MQAVGHDGGVGARPGDRRPGRWAPASRRLGHRALDRPVGLLVLEEQHRIGVVDGWRSSRPATSAGVDGITTLSPGDVGVERLDGLRVVQRAVDAAAPRGPHDQRHAEVAVGAVVDLGRLADQLVEGGVDEVGELDLGDRPQAGEGQRRWPMPDDGRSRPAGVSSTRRVAELGVSPSVALNTPPRGADVLAEHQDPLVGGHGSSCSVCRTVSTRCARALAVGRAGSGRSRRQRAMPPTGGDGGTPASGRSGLANTLVNAVGRLGAGRRLGPRRRPRRSRPCTSGSSGLLAASVSSRCSMRYCFMPLERVLLPPRLDLLRRAVGAVVVVGGVGQVAVGLALDQASGPRPLRARCTAACMARVDVEGVVAVDDHARQARTEWACWAMFSTADSLASGTEMA